jgi:hypothetical protein
LAECLAERGELLLHVANVLKIRRISHRLSSSTVFVTGTQRVASQCAGIHCFDYSSFFLQRLMNGALLLKR